MDYDFYNPYLLNKLDTIDAEELMADPEMKELCQQTYQEAKEALEKVGLYLNATGTGETGKVFTQEVEPNTPVEVGTAVEVKFVDEVADDKDAIDE
mgnify:CR=1 FL=1